MFHCKSCFLRYRQSNCRYVLTRYCSLTHKKRFVKKSSTRCEKVDFSQNLDFWQMKFCMGVGQQNVSL